MFCSYKLEPCVECFFVCAHMNYIFYIYVYIYTLYTYYVYIMYIYYMYVYTLYKYTHKVYILYALCMLYVHIYYNSYKENIRLCLCALHLYKINSYFIHVYMHAYMHIIYIKNTIRKIHSVRHRVCTNIVEKYSWNITRCTACVQYYNIAHSLQ